MTDAVKRREWERKYRAESVALLKRLGLCKRCKQDATPGMVTCERCREKNNQYRRKSLKAKASHARYDKKRYEADKRDGRCVACRARAVEGRTLCEEHAERARVAAREHRRLKKARGAA